MTKKDYGPFFAANYWGIGNAGGQLTRPADPPAGQNDLLPF